MFDTNGKKSDFLLSERIECISLNLYTVSMSEQSSLEIQNERILHLAVLAGVKLSEAGAETYRVEQTVSSILSISGCRGEAYALTTGLIASIDSLEHPPLTLIRRLKNRSINLAAVHEVNQIARDLAAGNLSLDEAEKQIEAIDRQHYSIWVKDVSTLLMSGAFALLLSGVYIDALASLLNGIAQALVNWLVRLSRIRPMMANTLAGLFTTIGARLIQTYIFPTANYDMIIAGSLMLMFPGTAITNAIRDTIHGDYVSGGARAVEAFLIAASLAIGAGLGLWLMGGMIGW